MHARLRMDLSAAYACEGIRVLREFSFTGAELTVTDDIQADHVAERFLSFLPTAVVQLAAPQLGGGTLAL